MITAREFVDRRGGDWRHPGVYSIVHLPTGLEYVGASQCVRSRVATHMKLIRRPCNWGQQWPAKLCIALALLKYGPLKTEAKGKTLWIDSLDVLRSLTGQDCAPLARQLVQDGTAPGLHEEDICPIWRRTCERDAAEIHAAEKHFYEMRRPVLNGPWFIPYTGSGHNAQSLHTGQPLGLPPKPMTDEEVRALPILLRREVLSRNDSRNEQILRKTRWRIAEQFRAKAVLVGQSAFNDKWDEMTADLHESVKNELPGHFGMAIWETFQNASN